MKLAGLIILVSVLTACMSTPSGRYSQRTDSTPEKISPDIDFANAEPRYEPYSPANLRPYRVLGKAYQPLKTGKGYSATGKASWYGQKFHGHLTANGETYNMFAMSAAHKTLPLPSFVRVTNLTNGNQTIVRVNDRGPFHEDRIIDVSYAAAIKLGLLKTGTAQVKLDVIHVDEQGQVTVGNRPLITPGTGETDKAWFVQVAALQNQQKIEQLALGLSNLMQVPAHTPIEGGLYRLRLGPVQNEDQAAQLLNQLKAKGYHGAYKLFVAP